jgi:hypothetical protein
MHFHEFNSSFHSPFKHHQISGTVIPQIQKEDMVQCAIQVFGNWDRSPNFVIGQPCVDADNEPNVYFFAIYFSLISQKNVAMGLFILMLNVFVYFPQNKCSLQIKFE